MRLCVARIQDDRTLEPFDGAGDGRRVERLQPDASLGEGLVGLETARLPVRPARRVRARGAERLGKLRDDPILQLEHLLEGAVGLRVRHRFAGRRVHDARGDAQAIAGALKAPDDGQVEVELLAEDREVRPDAPDRFDHAHAIDDAERPGGPEIVGHGLRDAGRQPRELAVGAHVREVEDPDCRRLVGPARRLDGGGGYDLGGPSKSPPAR